MSEQAETSGQPVRRFGWVAVPLVVFAVMAIVFAYALSTGDPSKLPSALIGKPAPEVSFPALAGLDQGGKPVAGIPAAVLRDGKVTVVNFWASWCGPCIQEHPFLIALAQHGGADIVGINYKDKPDNALRFLTRHGNPFARVGTDNSGRGAIEWGVYGVPETYVVDGKGQIIFKHVGPLDESSLRSEILPAIKRAAAR